jgi:hypothetical protein
VALLNGKLIAEGSLKTIWAPATLADGTIYRRPASGAQRGSGLGWVLGLDEPHPFAGGTGGVRAAFFIYTRDDLAVIVLTNTQGTGSESLAQGIAQRYLTGSAPQAARRVCRRSAASAGHCARMALHRGGTTELH